MNHWTIGHMYWVYCLVRGQIEGSDLIEDLWEWIWISTVNNYSRQSGGRFGKCWSLTEPEPSVSQWVSKTILQVHWSSTQLTVLSVSGSVCWLGAATVAQCRLAGRGSDLLIQEVPRQVRPAGSGTVRELQLSLVNWSKHSPPHPTPTTSTSTTSTTDYNHLAQLDINFCQVPVSLSHLF